VVSNVQTKDNARKALLSLIITHTLFHNTIKQSKIGFSLAPAVACVAQQLQAAGSSKGPCTAKSWRKLF
jgi:hypothetical protein